MWHDRCGGLYEYNFQADEGGPEFRSGVSMCFRPMVGLSGLFLLSLGLPSCSAAAVGPASACGGVSRRTVLQSAMQRTALAAAVTAAPVDMKVSGSERAHNKSPALIPIRELSQLPPVDAVSVRRSQLRRSTQTTAPRPSSLRCLDSTQQLPEN